MALADVKIWIELAVLGGGVFASWAVMRSQISVMATSIEKLEKTASAHSDKISKLETMADNLKTQISEGFARTDGGLTTVHGRLDNLMLAFRTKD